MTKRSTQSFHWSFAWLQSRALASKLKMMDGLGKILMGVGAVMFVAGGAILLASRLGWLPIGRLPGDVVVHRNGFSLYVPIVTCLFLSIIGSLILWLLGASRR